MYQLDLFQNIMYNDMASMGIHEYITMYDNPYPSMTHQPDHTHKTEHTKISHYYYIHNFITSKLVKFIVYKKVKGQMLSLYFPIPYKYN